MENGFKKAEKVRGENFPESAGKQSMLLTNRLMTATHLKRNRNAERRTL